MTENTAKLIYGAVNRPVLEAIPISAKRILDVGCGNGALGQILKQQRNVEVVGVTYSQAEADAANELDGVVVADLNNLQIADFGNFDCIVCSHVLEHLYWPTQVLRVLHRSLTPSGTVVVALPNVLFWRQRLVFLRGRFRYTQGGLMDETHFRFFDWTTAKQMVIDSGLHIHKASADGGFPMSRYIPVVGSWLDRAAVRFFPGIFGFQFVIVAGNTKND